MWNSTKNYFRLLAEGRKNGTLSAFLTPALGLAEKIYGGAVTAARALYENKILPRKRLPFPVVSVGNLTWGGTGKTPLVEYLARKVSERHKTPLVMTRGYSRDEIDQFHHHLPRSVIGVGKNRFRAAQDAAKKQRIDIGILDDGFQHWPIERDIEIVTVNALNPFGNGRLIPWGMLREPVSVLRRAAIVVLSHANLISAEELGKLKERIKHLAPEAFLAESALEPLFFFRARKRSRVSLDRLHKERVTTFSAVGMPRSFQMLLSNCRIKPVRNFEFMDHHVFSREELEEIKQVSAAASVEEIITTEKDFYRDPELISQVLNPLVLVARLRILSGEEVLTERLFRLLGV